MAPFIGTRMKFSVFPNSTNVLPKKKISSHLKTGKSLLSLSICQSNEPAYAQTSTKRKEVDHLNQKDKPATDSPTILSLLLQIFLCVEAFECNTTSDWLNHTVWPIRSCVAFKFTNLGGQRQRKGLVGKYLKNHFTIRLD